MSLHANTLNYVDRANIALVWAVTLGFTTPRRISEVGSAIGSALRGQFEARILSVSGIDIGYGDWRGGVEAQTVTIELEDGDNSFRNLFDGRSGLTLRNRSVTIELASPDLSPGTSPTDANNDWLVCFTGVLDGWERIGTAKYRLFARTDDAVLQRNPTIPLIGPADTPYAVDYVKADSPRVVSDESVSVAPVIGGAFPLVYGSHDSRALTGTVEGTHGAIPCRYLGEYPGSVFRYIVAVGVMFHVERVFKDGTFVSSSNWTRETFFAASGLVMTVIKFTATQGQSVITCDGWGIHSSMANPLAGAFDSAHAPMIRPTEIMEHFLVNFGYFSWRGESSWYSRTLTPIDTTTWDAAKDYDNTHAYEVCLYVDEAMANRKMIDILTEFARANEKRFWWTPTGKLAITSLDRFPASPYAATESALIVVDESPDYDAEAGVLRQYQKQDDVEIARRSYWRIAAQASTRSAATIYRPGIATGSARAVEQFDTVWSSGRRFMDRTMLTPASEKMALCAFNVGLTSGGQYIDGTSVALWDDNSNSFRTAYPMSQGTGANQPLLRLGKVNGRAFVEFDGVNDSLVGTVLSNLMSVSDFTIFIVFRVRAATLNNANAYQNHPIIADSTGQFGLYVRTAAGVYYLQADAWDGAHHTGEVQISLNTWYVAKFVHFGGSLTLTLTDQFAYSVSISSGNMTSLAGNLTLGWNGFAATPFTGDIAEVHVFSDGDISAQGVTAGFLGGGAAFEIGHQLREDYGIAG